MKYGLLPITSTIRRKVIEFCQYWTILMSKSFFSRKKCGRKQPTNTMYIFRPYELVKVNYKCYDGLFDKGKNSYPKPRSGHRIVCNDSDLYCFGGFNPNRGGHRTNRTMFLFQELWKFDLFTKKWNVVYSSSIEGMPEELASNAVILKNNMLIVWESDSYHTHGVQTLKIFLFFFHLRFRCLVEQAFPLEVLARINAICFCHTTNNRNQFLR